MPFEIKLLLTLSTYAAVFGMMASYSSLMAVCKKRNVSPRWIKWSAVATFEFFLFSFIAEVATGMILSRSGLSYPVFDRAFTGIFSFLADIKGVIFLLLLAVSFFGAIIGYSYADKFESNPQKKKIFIILQSISFTLGVVMPFLAVIMPAH